MIDCLYNIPAAGRHEHRVERAHACRFQVFEIVGMEFELVFGMDVFAPQSAVFFEERAV